MKILTADFLHKLDQFFIKSSMNGEQTQLRCLENGLMENGIEVHVLYDGDKRIKASHPYFNDGTHDRILVPYTDVNLKEYDYIITICRFGFAQMVGLYGQEYLQHPGIIALLAVADDQSIREVLRHPMCADKIDLSQINTKYTSIADSLLYLAAKHANIVGFIDIRSINDFLQKFSRNNVILHENATDLYVPKFNSTAPYTQIKNIIYTGATRGGWGDKLRRIIEYIPSNHQIHIITQHDTEKEFQEFSNVNFIGFKSFYDIMPYIFYADFALAFYPGFQIGVTRGDSSKSYHYLRMGCPVFIEDELCNSANIIDNENCGISFSLRSNITSKLHDMIDKKFDRIYIEKYCIDNHTYCARIRDWISKGILYA